LVYAAAQSDVDRMDTLLTKLQVRGIGETTKSMSVVAAYEDFSTRARVNEFCRGLARDLDADCEMIKQVWLVNLLRLPQLRAIAVHDATSADMVIISMHDAPSLPDETKAWIELWLQEKGNRPTVLVALLDVMEHDDAGAVKRYLAEVAKRGNMEFVVQSWEKAGGPRS
jgi:hypothetical protein